MLNNSKACSFYKSVLMFLVFSSGIFYTSSSYAQQEIEKSVVKIYTTQRRPDIFNPWAKMPSNEISGSGVIISGNRILTNAHVVTYASQVYVQPYQSAEKISAEVLAIAPGIDLALLKLEDEDFFKDHPPVQLSETIPRTGEKVNAYGYPMGGSGLSVTEGIVSRIEFSSYYYDTSGLRIQVDAALNPGNSGGPVISNNKIMGIVFSGIRQADNIGYLIPVEEVKIFLDDIADGRYDGKHMIFDQMQTLENDALREKLGLKKNQTGMMVTSPYCDSGKGLLQKWDIITNIGDEKIDNEGKVITGDGLRLNFAYLIQHLEKDNKINLTVIRKGKEIKIDLPLDRERNVLLPNLKDGYPSYLIYGPLVFSPATNDLVRYMQRDLINLLRRSSPLVTRLNDTATEEQEQLIVISSRMFSHKITKGYGDPFSQVIKDINGIKIKNIKHLVEVIRDMKGPYAEINFEGNYVETMIFRKDDMEAATEDVLSENGIRFQCSSDLMPVLKQP
ncbi:MAG: trypsin-like peptidase domain-containing protein [Deltaproteobacteria bacterium]|nr:trypsin-like peptidase domain-containing protein [Deltaproteobacteria bacterium]